VRTSLFLLIFISSLAAADVSSVSRNQKAFDEICAGIDDDGVYEPVMDVGAMVWGTGTFFPTHEGAKAQWLDLDTKLLTSPSIEVYSWEAPKEKSKNELVVFFPGLFQTGNSIHANRIVEILQPEGFDVVVVPSAFNYLFTNIGLRFMPGTALNEGRVANSILYAFLKANNKSYSRIHAVGMSAGSLIALASNRLDEKRVFNGELVMLSPLPDLASSIRKLDELIKKYDESWKILHPLLYLTADNFKPGRGDLLYGLKQNLSVLSQSGQEKFLFKSESLKLLQAADETTATEIPYGTIMSEMSFGNSGDSRAEMSRLDYWLNQFTGSRTRPHFLCTCNDYLVNRSDWYQMPLDLKARARIQTSGGHNGYFSEDWFSNWLIETLTAKK
jgi:hypothetical protein